MKIRQIITEDSDVDVTKLFNQPFFKHNKLTSILNHHTVSQVKNEKIEKRKLEPRKGPRDTSLMVHNYLGKLTQEEFGLNIRQDTLFCYSASFNEVSKLMQFLSISPDQFIIVPEGEYSLYMVPNVHDMTVNLGLGLIENAIVPNFDIKQIMIDNEKIEKIAKEQLQKTAEKYDVTPTSGDLMNEKINIEEAILRILIPQMRAFVEEYNHLSDLEKNIEKDLHKVFEVIGKEIKYLSYMIGERVSLTIPNILKNELIKAFTKLFHEKIKSVKVKLEKYVDNIQEIKSLEDIDHEELMLYCDYFYIINAEYYKKLIKEITDENT